MICSHETEVFSMLLYKVKWEDEKKREDVIVGLINGFLPECVVVKLQRSLWKLSGYAGKGWSSLEIQIAKSEQSAPVNNIQNFNSLLRY